MKTGLVVDSACDLPDTFITDNNIFVIPLNISIAGESIGDTLSETERLAIYNEGRIDKSMQAESSPTTTEQIKEYMLDNVVTKTDFAICETIARSRSPTYSHYLDVSQGMQVHAQEIRKQANCITPFSMRVVSTGTVFSGQGLTAAHTIKLINEGISKNQLRRAIEEFKPQVKSFGIPPDLTYLRNRARKKGDKSVGFLTSIIGKALEVTPVVLGCNEETYPIAKIRGFENALKAVLNFVATKVQSGLSTPYIVISIAGDPKELFNFNEYASLQNIAQSHNIEILLSVMSLSGGINLGPGSITVSVAYEGDDVEIDAQ
ncbi:DegV family protein [Marinibactrum halimedae]|uniref:DegV domain-containing protein n=1 Tax=Marinibactrum halimedae TaxID=1444977 RepID=A0AA37T7R1_9GAMM|nr:DegV family protein [Marinibactrum halimedae]MCD9457495.1 DegV family protein [Marinibactrum halimedae]GLS25451.1 DegV domain-containing protein [Marinibactrum halimedae]